MNLNKEKVVTEEQKSTYAKMFNPDKRKEEETKRKEEETKKKEDKKNKPDEKEKKIEKKKDNEDNYGSYLKIAFGVAAVATLVYAVYKKNQ